MVARFRHWILPLIAVLATAYGLYRAIDLAWLCDDAFISFRYARHLVEGHGLVFNVGEYVEGYTNFLWTLLIAGGLWLGFSVEGTAQVLGVICYLATVVLLLAVGLRREYRSRAGEMVPVAALALGLHHHASSMASFGLETALFALLLTGALVALVRARLPWAGWLLTLATLTRPDGALLYAVACGVVLARSWGRGRLRGFLALVVPGLLVGVPYVIWKLVYYGDILPNTFYAKSAADPYPGQGLWYVGLYFWYYPLLAVGLVAPWVFLWRRRSRFEEALWITAFTVPYLVYVVWVGGDFMFARFCLPVTPALCLGLQLLVPVLGTWLSRLLVLLVVSASLLCQAVLENVQSVDTGSRVIAEERNFYPPEITLAHRFLGDYLHRRLSGFQPVLGIDGATAMLAYYCQWPEVIELNGLTDRTIARRRIRKRGRVGHEKVAGLKDPYVLGRRVDFVCYPLLLTFRPVEDRVPEHLRELTFLIHHPAWKEGKEAYRARLTLLTYDARMMAALRGDEDVGVASFEEFLDGYIADLPQKPKAEVALDYADFRQFYFDRNQDTGRQQAFEDFLR